MAENQTNSVSVKTSFNGLDSECRKIYEKKISRIQRRLESSDLVRSSFILDTFDYLAVEGLLEEASSVHYEMAKGSFSELALVRRASLRNPGLGLQPPRLGIVIEVCVTITIVVGPVVITITICGGMEF